VGNQAVQLLLAGDDVPYYRLHRARLEARALPGEYAEFATERASSRCFQRQRMQGAAGEQLETRCRDRTAVVGRALVARAQTIGTEVPINLWNGGLRIADDDGIEIGRAQARVAAGESTAEHRRGAASAPGMGELARAVEVRMQRRNEQQSVIARPVRIGPLLVDDVDFHIARQQAGEQRADLRLHRNPVLFPAPVVVHVHGNDAYTHRFFLRVPFSGADAAVSAWGLVPGIGGVAVRQYAIELQAEPAGFDDRLGATVDVERAQDGRDVNLDSAFGQAQFAADHLARFAL